MKETPVISRIVARRMAIVAQGLAGPRSRPDSEGIMDFVNQLGCLQLDPINTVAAVICSCCGVATTPRALLKG